MTVICAAGFTRQRVNHAHQLCSDRYVSILCTGGNHIDVKPVNDWPEYGFGVSDIPTCRQQGFAHICL